MAFEQTQEDAQGRFVNARSLDLPLHEYTGEQNHCRFCYNEYMRRFRAAKFSVQHEEHDFISYWHCRACKNHGNALHMQKVRSKSPDRYREYNRLQAIAYRLTKREERELESYKVDDDVSPHHFVDFSLWMRSGTTEACDAERADTFELTGAGDDTGARYNDDLH